MKSILLKTSVTFFLLIALVPFISQAQKKEKQPLATGGEMSFTFRTVPFGGPYAPRHVLAVWVEDTDGFVKTKLLRGTSKKKYLYTWKTASNYNVIDAITGPTLTSHQTHTVTWDCTDLDGNIVPDGDYNVWAEFTDKHAQGPLKTITFTKGPEPLTMTLPDEDYFKDMVFEFTPYIADFTADVTHICEDGTVTFTDSSTNATSWEWDFGDFAYPPTADTQGPHTIIYSAPGLKTVTLTINGNITETKTDFIIVDSIPTAEFTYEVNDLTVQFTNTSTNATDYLWDFGDGETSEEVNPVHTYAAQATYTVTLTASDNFCSDASVSQEVAVNPNYVNEIRSEPFTIYPNPGTGLFTLKANRDTEDNVSINVFDQNGKEIFIEHNISFGNKSLKFDLTSYGKGVYFVKVRIDDKVYFRKLVII